MTQRVRAVLVVDGVVLCSVLLVLCSAVNERMSSDVRCGSTQTKREVCGTSILISGVGGVVGHRKMAKPQTLCSTLFFGRS